MSTTDLSVGDDVVVTNPIVSRGVMVREGMVGQVVAETDMTVTIEAILEKTSTAKSRVECPKTAVRRLG